MSRPPHHAGSRPRFAVLWRFRQFLCFLVAFISVLHMQMFKQAVLAFSSSRHDCQAASKWMDNGQLHGARVRPCAMADDAWFVTSLPPRRGPTQVSAKRSTPQGTTLSPAQGGACCCRPNTPKLYSEPGHALVCGSRKAHSHHNN